MSATADRSPGPVIVGAAEVANRDDERIVHPVALVAEAARAALDDAAVPIEQVAGVLSTPFSTIDVDDASDLVAAELGCTGGLRGTSSYSGAGPLSLLGRAVEAVRAGAGPILVVGGIADASVARARRQGIEPPAPATSSWSQGSVEQTRSSRRQDPGRARTAEVAAGAGLPPAWFALAESARADAGMDARQRGRLGALLSPFAEVAAARADVAWFPRPRTADEIARPTDANRLVAEPYTKLMCSFPTVDLAAALVVAPPPRAADRAVGIRSIALAREAGPPSTWARMDRFDAMHRAAALALDTVADPVEQVAAFDLYSCFPAAITMAADALGIAPDDPRPRTLTGGLPYFGGPGASYSLHALVAAVARVRRTPDERVVIASTGGMVTDAGVGVLDGTLGDPRIVDLGVGPVGAEVRATGSGPAVVEAMTVLHESERGPVAAPVIARLPDGARVGARAADRDLPAATSGRSLVGAEVALVTDDDGRVTYRLR